MNTNTNKRAHCAVVAAAAAVQSRKKAYSEHIQRRELKRRNNQVPPISYTKTEKKLHTCESVLRSLE